jgi:hypothetical protein
VARRPRDGEADRRVEKLAAERAEAGAQGDVHRMPEVVAGSSAVRRSRVRARLATGVLARTAATGALERQSELLGAAHV